MLLSSCPPPVLLLLCAVGAACVAFAAAAPDGIFTSFVDYQRAGGAARVASAPRAGAGKIQYSDYYDKHSHKVSSYPFTVPFCGDDTANVYQ